MPENKICSECDSIVKGQICLKCGNVLDPALLEKESKTDSDSDVISPDAKESHKNSKTDKEKPPEPVDQINSIFASLTVDSGSAGKKEDLIKKHSKIFQITLGLVFLILAAASYWRFVYVTPEYLNPLVLSASAETTEKVISYELGMPEGVFDQTDYMQFAPPTINLTVEAFNIEDTFNKFLKIETLKTLLKDFDVSSDDLSVYFTPNYAFMFPNGNLEDWGFIVEVKDKEFVEKRMETFKKAKEEQKDKYKYSNLEAQLVTLEISNNGEAEVVDGKSIDTTKIEEELAKEEEKTTAKETAAKEEDTEKKAEGQTATTEEEKPTTKSYLLISNSKEFLDQMQESSEGNLLNLKSDLQYANSQADLPKLGQVRIYKLTDSSAWTALADLVGSKLSYIGFDKILKNIKSQGVAIYTVDSKLKIANSEN